MTTPRLSEHFTVAEFASRDGVALPAALHTSARYLCEWWLEPFRARFGPVTVHSGYRTAAHNLRVGGARNSVHLGRTEMPRRPAGSRTMALAADVVAREGAPSVWRRWAREHRRRHAHLGLHGRGGLGVYLVQGFVHLDTGPERDWRG